MKYITVNQATQAALKCFKRSRLGEIEKIEIYTTYAENGAPLGKYETVYIRIEYYKGYRNIWCEKYAAIIAIYPDGGGVAARIDEIEKIDF